MSAKDSIRVLIIGGGGREHALAWQIRRSPLVSQIYCAPGNSGIAKLAECVPISVSDIEEAARFAIEKAVDVTIVGPELPLTLGLVDRFTAAGLIAFGPTAQSARLESSKAWAKNFMKRYNIPTPNFTICNTPAAAMAEIRRRPLPIVIKADGLAAGKGTSIAFDEATAREAVQDLMVKQRFGTAGRLVVIEEAVEGREISYIILTDGNYVIPMMASHDYKNALEGDQGPNTGGMGGYAPVPWLTSEDETVILRRIVYPTLAGLRHEGLIYRGVLYFGIMVTRFGPMVLEFNVRFGDPETQIVLPLLDCDLLPTILAASKGDLGGARLIWKRRNSVCVVLAANGYPVTPQTGGEVRGLEFKNNGDVFLFYANCEQQGDHWIATGGRVLNIVGVGSDFEEAYEVAYRAVGKISSESLWYRRDIANELVRNNSMR